MDPPHSGSFSLFFCSLYSTHVLLLILYCFSLFFSSSFLFFSRGDEDVAKREGGTCDRVGCPPSHVTLRRQIPMFVHSIYHHSYVLPRASDQLRAPRPTPTVQNLSVVNSLLTPCSHYGMSLKSTCDHCKWALMKMPENQRTAVAGLFCWGIIILRQAVGSFAMSKVFHFGT